MPMWRTPPVTAHAAAPPALPGPRTYPLELEPVRFPAPPPRNRRVGKPLWSSEPAGPQPIWKPPNRTDDA